MIINIPLQVDEQKMQMGEGAKMLRMVLNIDLDDNPTIAEKEVDDLLSMLRAEGYDEGTYIVLDENENVILP